jgi:hypothetical protein
VALLITSYKRHLSENAGVTSLNHIMDTVTKIFLTFEKIKTLIKSNNFIRYYTLISNIPTDIKRCLKDNIDNINTENFHPKDDFLDRLINTKSLKFVYITLLKTLTHLPIQKFLKWEEILGIDIADWSKSKQKLFFVKFNIVKIAFKTVIESSQERKYQMTIKK